MDGPAAVEPQGPGEDAADFSWRGRLMTPVCTILALLLLTAPAPAADQPKRGPKEALQAFNDLIGDWRATGVPEGTREKRQREFWTESLNWSWQFKGDDAWLTVGFDKGKHFTGGELRYL